jgi:hypothetical protein
MNSSELTLGLIPKILQCGTLLWPAAKPNSVTRSFCKASADNRKWNERPSAEGSKRRAFRWYHRETAEDEDDDEGRGRLGEREDGKATDSGLRKAANEGS